MADDRDSARLETLRQLPRAAESMSMSAVDLIRGNARLPLATRRRKGAGDSRSPRQDARRHVGPPFSGDGSGIAPRIVTFPDRGRAGPVKPRSDWATTTRSVRWPIASVSRVRVLGQTGRVVHARKVRRSSPGAMSRSVEDRGLSGHAPQRVRLLSLLPRVCAQRSVADRDVDRSDFGRLSRPSAWTFVTVTDCGRSRLAQARRAVATSTGRA